MPTQEPAVAREGALTLVHQFSPQDRVARSPQATRGALVTGGGAWVIDLVEARVVMWIPVPQGIRYMELVDEESLWALCGDDVLRAWALPDGGCVAEVPVPGASSIADVTRRVMVLWGDASLRLSEDRARVERDAGGALLYAVDLRLGAVTAAIDDARFARALSAFSAERERLSREASAVSPWGALSPDGDTFALAYEARAREVAPWSVGDVGDGSWSHAYTFRLDAPEATLERWAAPLEGWTLAWRASDTLTGCMHVATGPPPYRTMPFVRRRIRRDGHVVTWRMPDTDLLLAPGASAMATDLDDDRFIAWITAPRAAHAITWDPATGATDTRDLLADVPRATLLPDAPVLAGVWSDGVVVRALPRLDGRVRITVAGATVAETPARLGPPSVLRAAPSCLELQWTPRRGAWCAAFARRAR